MGDYTVSHRAFIRVGGAWVNVDHIVSVQSMGGGSDPYITEVRTVSGLPFFDGATTVEQMMELIKEAMG